MYHPKFHPAYPAEIADSHKALHVKLEMMTPDRREESSGGWFLSLTQTSEGRERAGEYSSVLAGPTAMAYGSGRICLGWKL